MTKSIILVKICLYVIQGFKYILTSWPQLISKFLVAPACLGACKMWNTEKQNNG